MEADQVERKAGQPMTLEHELLKTDFQQCFEQMRYYDSIFWSTVKFMVTGYAVVFTATGGLLGLKLSSGIAWTGITVLLFFTGFAGTLLLLVLLRSRMYYLRVARFVNEVRQAYINQKVMGVQNIAGLYTDPRSPKAMNPTSTQLITTYFTAICNSLFYAFGTAAACAELKSEVLRVHLLWPSIVFAAALVGQLVLVVLYLKLRDKDNSRPEGARETKDR